MAISDLISTALLRLTTAIQVVNPIAVLGLFSGGHDSFSATYIASLHPRFTAAVHINTGIGIEATRMFVRDTCALRKWPLLEYRAVDNITAGGKDDPMIYADMVERYGFPGPHGHRYMYSKLKERQLCRLERDFEASARKGRLVMYVSGCRSQESTRRMANTKPFQVDGRRVWVAPIHDWSKLDTSDLMEHVGQQRNEVVDLIHKSGECLCGAFSRPGELEELGLWPQTRPAYNYIRRLEAYVRPIHGYGWEGRPPKKCKNDDVPPGALCWSCHK